MTRDEALDIIEKAAFSLPLDAPYLHTWEAILDALIAAGWTGPGEKETAVYGAGVGPTGNGQPVAPAPFEMPRQLPMPEYKFQKEEHGSMQTNYHKVGPVYTIDDVKDGRAEWQDKENARIEKIDLGSPKAIRYSLDDLNTARSLARNAALEEAADLAHSYGGVGEAFISAAILELKVDFPATKTVI